MNTDHKNMIKNVLEIQGHDIKDNILYQTNQSTIRMEDNWKEFLPWYLNTYRYKMFVFKSPSRYKVDED